MNNPLSKSEHATIDFGLDEGDRIFQSILEDYPELDDGDHRRSSIIHTMFINAAQYLHIHGWSERELIEALFTHCEIARKWADKDAES